MNNYKEVKNYIHNDLKVSKDDIKSIIQEEVKKQINFFVKDESNFDIFIKKAFEDVLKIAVAGDDWGYQTKFRDKMIEIVRGRIGQMVVDRLDIKMEIK